ncbi:hypothetical protein, partial [Streptomyces violascens]
APDPVRALRALVLKLPKALRARGDPHDRPKMPGAASIDAARGAGNCAGWGLGAAQEFARDGADEATVHFFIRRLFDPVVLTVGRLVLPAVGSRVRPDG